jgi:hypothetical protein
MEKFFVFRMDFRNGVEYHGGTIGQDDDRDHPFDDFAKNIRRRSVKDLQQAAFHGMTRTRIGKMLFSSRIIIPTGNKSPILGAT